MSLHAPPVGTEAPGSTSVVNPVKVGGVGEDGNTHAFFTDSFGAMFARACGNAAVGAAPTQPPVVCGAVDQFGNVKIPVVGGVGAEGNAWSAAGTGAGGTSAVIDLKGLPNVSVFGNTSGATTITIQLSENGSTFYDSEITIAANGNFGKCISGVGAAYMRLKSSNNITATATIAAK